MRTPTLLFVLTLAYASVFSFALAGQESGVRADVQYSLFARILEYDRALAGRVGDEVVIGVLYQEESQPSREAMIELREAAAASTITHVCDVPARIQTIALGDLDALGALMAEGGVDILYVTPLRSVDIGALGAVAAEMGILTLTGVPEYIGRGLAVAVKAWGDGPGIVIDTTVATNQGADFSAQLLKIASLVDRVPQ